MSEFWVREMSKVLEHWKKINLNGRARFGAMFLLLQYLKLFFFLVDMTFFLREDGVENYGRIWWKGEEFLEEGYLLLMENRKWSERGFSIKMLKFDDVSEG